MLHSKYLTLDDFRKLQALIGSMNDEIFLLTNYQVVVINIRNVNETYFCALY